MSDNVLLWDGLGFSKLGHQRGHLQEGRLVVFVLS